MLCCCREKYKSWRRRSLCLVSAGLKGLLFSSPKANGRVGQKVFVLLLGDVYIRSRTSDPPWIGLGLGLR